ncbi:MAG: zf-HC2 domain-containing protein [Acidobacteria bacterium]|nr:zf-HC2 domain-containing protein [Acidobacteriota bacterium]MBS1864585.1 zf-HC2 domain-containing protein [Acidobacteriota bacterium]
MALDDRERNFEKALGQQLRANAGAGLDCPDAETLAAYHERMLSPDEMSSLKSHIAACPSCQEVLSTLEVTDVVPLEERDSEKVLAKREQVALSPVYEELAFSKAPGPAAKASGVREMPKPRHYRKWIAPAGAIAAGLLIWVAIDAGWNKRKLANQPAPAVEIAQNRELKNTPPTTPDLDSRASIPAAKPAEKTLPAENELYKQNAQLAETDKETQSLSRAKANSAKGRGPAMMQNQVQNQIQNNGSLNQSRVYDYSVQNQEPPKQVAPKTTAPARSETRSQDLAAAPLPPAPSVVTGAGTGNGMGERRKDQASVNSETVEVTTAASGVADAKIAPTGAAANLPANGKSYQKLGNPASGVASDAATTAKKEKQAAEAGRMQLKKADTGYVAGAMASASLRDAEEFRLSVVRTTDKKVFWVISREGEVFRSEDAGKSSQKQEIGAGIKAIAGSATDAKTCWILAENGMVIRTADGGQHWAAATAPAGFSFTTITALDATHATVSDASGKIGYTTSDGGATWNVMVH